jgi:uncharacterized protein YndB with AHSA1/START domain
MTARLRFPDAYSYGTAQYGVRQCDGGSCLANDAFTLREVPFASFPDLRLATLELRRVTAGQAPLRSASEILTRAKWLFPGGLFIDVPPYRETLDITDETRRSASQYDDGSWTCGGVDYPAGTTGAAADRSCRWDAVAATMRDWISRNPARRKASGGIFGSNTVIRDYDVAMGAHNYGGEPGASQGNILSVGRSEPMETNLVPLMTADATTRPLTAAAHELGHVLTAPHAGRDCPTPMGTPGNLTGTGKDQEGEIWRGDDRGLLQGTKFIQRLTGAAAEVQGAFSSPTEGTFSGGNLFDLMSYCAPATDTFASDGNAWISAYNWNRFTRELGNLARRLGGSATSSRVQATSSRVRATSSASRAKTYAVGVAGARSGRIMRVRSDRQAVVPGSVAGSPLRLRSLDAAGRVLLDAGVAVKGSTHSPGTGTFLGPVASGAAAVELVHGSAVVNKVTRTKPPKVSVLSPGRRTRVRGRGRFTVRWRASDPDSRALRATVDYSPDGRNWRSVFEGPSTGRARIPGRYLAASKRARIRVTLSDGFAQASATSRRFRALGTRPRVRVLSPEGGAFLQTGERVTLIGSATDDFGIPIRGRRLTWYAGRKRLGRGARLRRRLPAGTRRLRLVARDRTGRKGVASLAVRVRRPRLRIARLVVPAKVRRKATTMTVRIRTSAPARLTVGRRRYRIGRRTTKVTIRLPRRPKVGIVGVRFKLSPRGGKAAGTTRGRFSTVRT